MTIGELSIKADKWKIRCLKAAISDETAFLRRARSKLAKRAISQNIRRIQRDLAELVLTQ